MAARVAMAQLITRTRSLVNDASSVTFTDETVQMALDQCRQRARYLPLHPEPTTTASGTTYLVHFSDYGDWEEDTALVDGAYATLTPSASDYLAGRWTFSTEPTSRPVRVTGYTYDLYGAAALLIAQQLAGLGRQYDFAADGGDYKRSQQYTALRDLMNHYRTLSRTNVKFAEQVRGDVNPRGW